MVSCHTLTHVCCFFTVSIYLSNKKFHEESHLHYIAHANTKEDEGLKSLYGTAFVGAQLKDLTEGTLDEISAAMRWVCHIISIPIWMVSGIFLFNRFQHRENIPILL